MILVEGLHHISLGSSDLKRSAEFYTEVLDFELLEESENHALVRLDPVAIRFNLIPDFNSSIENPGEFSLSFILDVDDFTEAIQELEQRDIKIIKGPLLIEGGESLLVADPDGHLLELFYRE